MQKRILAERWLELIQSRRSIRRFQPDPFSPEIIDKLLEVANWAPSAHNKQLWRFAVIANPTLKDDIASIMGDRLREDLIADGLAVDTIVRDATRSYRRITSAPLLILVCLSMEDMDRYSDDRRQQHEATMAIQSTAMAGQNLLLAAQALELGACWICAPLFCPGAVKGCLQIPASWQPQGLIAVGYAAETRKKTRRPIAEQIQYRP